LIREAIEKGLYKSYKIGDDNVEANILNFEDDTPSYLRHQ